MEASDKKYPYRLTVNVLRAEKLMIADIISSDPYVKLSIGGRIIGQTTYIPSTLSPVWKQSFTCNLLHNQNTLLLQVMDHDDFTADDPLGDAEVDLRSLPFNTLVEHKRVLKNVGNVVVKGSIFVSLLLEKIDNIIAINYQMNEPSGKKSLRSGTEIVQMNMEFQNCELSMPLKEALMTAPAIQLSPTLDWMLLKDLVIDITMLKNDTAFMGQDANRRYVIKEVDYVKSFAQATRIDLFKDSQTKISFPLEDKFSLVLETDSEVYYLKASNVFQQWAWTRAFQTAVDGTATQVKISGNLSVKVGEDLREHKCFFTSSSTAAYGVHREIVCEDLSTNEIRRLDVSTLRAITVSYDYAFSKKYELVVEIVSGRLKPSSRTKLTPSQPHRRFHSSVLGGQAASEASSAEPESRGKWTSKPSPKPSSREELDFYFVGDGGGEAAPDTATSVATEVRAAFIVDDNTHANTKRKWYPGSMLFRAGKGAAGLVLNTVGQTVSTTANVVSTVAVTTGAGVGHVVGGTVGVFKGVGNTGVKVVKGTVKGVVATGETAVDLATGRESAGRVVNRMAEGTVTGVTSVASRGLDIAQGKLTAEVYSELHVRGPGGREQKTAPIVGTTPFWNTIYTLSLDECEIEESLMNPASGLSLFLFQGERGEENLTSTAFLPIRSLLLHQDQLALPPRLADVLPRGCDGETPLLQHEVPMGAPYQHTSSVLPEGKHCITLHCTVIGASDLVFPAANPACAGINSNNIFTNMLKGDCSSPALQAVLCLVKWMGQDRGRKFKRYKTATDSTHINPVWNETIEVTDKEGLDWASYMRIEVLDTRKEKEAGGRLGAAFIPVDRIPTTDAVEMTVPLVPHRSLERMKIWRERGGLNGCLGSVRVRVQRKLSRMAHVEDSVILRSQLREVGAMNSFWPARSILAGSLLLTDADKWAQTCAVYPSLDGLFVDVDVKSRKEGIDVLLNHFVIDASTYKEEVQGPDGPEKKGLMSMFHLTSNKQHREGDAYRGAIDTSQLGRKQFEKNRSKYGNIIEVYCFENQRKDAFKDIYSAKALTALERPFLSDEGGMVAFPFPHYEQCVCPNGYEWVPGSKWEVDVEHTNCDEYGWSYAVDFLYLMSNLRNQESKSVDTNCFVRRRKVGRFARKTFFPRSGHNDTSGDHHSVGGQLDYTPPIFTAVNRAETFQREGAATVLSLALERGVSDKNGCCSGPVVIPWNQVMSVHVVTPSVLSIIVGIRRFLGITEEVREGNVTEKRENFADAECEIFVYNCPAEDLSLVVRERMSVCEVREQLDRLLATNHIDGDAGLLREKKTSMAEEGSADVHAKVNVEEISDEIALSQGAVLMSQLDEAIILMELKLDKLREKYGEKCKDLEEYKVLIYRISRLNLYLATLLSANLRGGDASLDTFEKDREVAESLHSSALSRGMDPVSAAIEQVNYLLDAMEGRVRNLSLSGYKMKNDELDRRSGILLNNYYIETVRVLAVFFDSFSKLESIPGHTRKLDLITFIINNDDRMKLAIDGALRPYSRVSSPSPYLSQYLDINKFIGWYSVLLHNEMKLWVDRCFNKSSMYDKSDSQFRYPLPWEPIEASQTYLSNLRVDLVGSLQTFLNMPRPVPTPLTSVDMFATIDVLNKAIISAYGTCFLYVASKLRSTLISSEWASPPPEVSPTDEQAVFDSISGQMFWLCSVANDAVFYVEHVKKALESEAADMEAVQTKVAKEIAKYGKNHVSSNAERQLELSHSVEITLHESAEAFSAVVKITADYLSCIIFKSFIDILIGRLTSEWIEVMVQHDDSVTPIGVGVSKTTVGDEKTAESGRSALEVVLESLVLDFESYHQLVDSQCYHELVFICADKFVTRYYGLLRALATHKAVFSNIKVIDKLRDEINKIIKCLCSVLRHDSASPEQTLYYGLIIKKFDHLYSALYLIEMKVDSDEFIEKLQIIKNFAHENQTLAVALAALIRTCISLKPNGESILNAETSVIPLLCCQIESYATLTPVETTKKVAKTAAAEVEDLEMVAKMAASEVHENQLRPNPLVIIFDSDVVWPINKDTKLLKKSGGIFGDILGGGSTGGIVTSSAVPNVEVFNTKLSAALLCCSAFYKVQPKKDVPKQKAEAVTEPRPAERAAVRHIEPEKQTKRGSFLSFFSRGSTSNDPVSESSHDKSVHEQISAGPSPEKNPKSIVPLSIKPPVPFVDFTEISAKNLFSTASMMAIASNPNSYVTIAIDHGSDLNTDVANNTLEPRWVDPRLKLAIPPGYMGGIQLKLSLFYKKRFSSVGPELIGSVIIPLEKFDISKNIDEEYPINVAESSDHVVNCFVKSTASGIPAPTLRVVASLVTSEQK